MAWRSASARASPRRGAHSMTSRDGARRRERRDRATRGPLGRGAGRTGDMPAARGRACHDRATMKRVIAALAGGLLACGSAPDEAAPAVPARVDWIEAVRGVLPPGAAITGTAHDVVPDGWISERANGLLVE